MLATVMAQKFPVRRAEFRCYAAILSLLSGYYFPVVFPVMRAAIGSSRRYNFLILCTFSGRLGAECRFSTAAREGGEIAVIGGAPPSGCGDFRRRALYNPIPIPVSSLSPPCGERVGVRGIGTE
jgi:hypothetical protein